jgi:hypothetical protein
MSIKCSCEITHRSCLWIVPSLILCGLLILLAENVFDFLSGRKPGCDLETGYGLFPLESLSIHLLISVIIM